MSKPKPFRMTPKQREAHTLLGGPQTHTLLEGGSRSGKTFLLCRAIAARALKASGSRHAILRFRFNHLLSSVYSDTWPKMLDLCFPGLRKEIKDDKHLWLSKLPNQSEIWWGGLDDKERTEKVLGQEHATIYLNECSQISFSSRSIAVTRLAQQVAQDANGGRMLAPRMYHDANPPSKGHWLYKLFHQRIDPVSGRKMDDAQAANFARMLLNPADNAANLPPQYMLELQNLPPHLRARFWAGEYADDNPNALFSIDDIEKWRAVDGDLPKMQRIVVAVDPSGADEDHPEADAIGIVVGGLGVDGNGYLLEDLTVSGVGPATWGKVAVAAYMRHAADAVVGERNFGGAMVKFTIRTAEREAGTHLRYREVTASRGKVVRAEPISALYADGRVRHAGHFADLESELCAFSTTGYTGEASPNRGDAAIWLWTELFPGLTRRKPEPQAPRMRDYGYDDDGHDVESWKVA